MIAHRELMAEVQRNSRLDRSTTTSLLTALQRVLIDAALCQQPVQLSGLGTFTAHKHPEYIQDDATRGQSVLYPPRITCRIDFDKQ